MKYSVSFLMAGLALSAGVHVHAQAPVEKKAATPATKATSSAWALPATDDGLPGTGPIRRYDWFQKLWTEKRSGWARRVQQDQDGLVFLGDSITQGWAANLTQLFPGIKTVNRGISGDTTRGVLIRLKGDVLVLKPRGVVLLIGTNDLEEEAAPESTAGNLKLILAALKEHNPAMPVVLCNVFPSSATKKRPVEQIRKINQLCYALLKDEPQVTWLDTWSLFANAQGDAKPEEFPDLLHPNSVGYIKWSAALRPVLENVGLAPAWPDDFAVEPGFESLFNGRDLSGWGYADKPAFDGKTVSDDGRFAARNGRLVVTVAREERAYRKLLTTRKFSKDFVLKMEFRASPNADSGVFVREPQLQVRDYHLAGPWLTLKGYRPLEWNELVVTVRGGLAHATCNGEVLVDAFPVPASGPIGVESDKGQIEYRRIRVQETR
jgi:lysophospholipase L1-like esterase